MNPVDWVIIIFILLGCFKGYRRGLLASMFSLVGYIAAFVLAVIYTPSVVEWLDAKKNLTQSVFGFLEDRGSFPEVSVQGFSEVDIKGIIESLPVPEVYQQEIFQNVNDTLSTMGAGTEEVISSISLSITSLLLNGLIFAVLFAIILIFVRIIVGLVTKLSRGTVIGGLNRFGGLIFGGIVNALFIGLIIGILSPWLSVGAASGDGGVNWISRMLEQSVVAPYFTDLFGWVVINFMNVL